MHYCLPSRRLKLRPELSLLKAAYSCSSAGAGRVSVIVRADHVHMLQPNLPSYIQNVLSFVIMVMDRAFCELFGLFLIAEGLVFNKSSFANLPRTCPAPPSQTVPRSLSSSSYIYVYPIHSRHGAGGYFVLYMRFYSIIILLAYAMLTP